MTEQEWLACADPEPMLHFARPLVGEAQLRLFACGCCRRVWSLFPDVHCKQAIVIAELFAYRHAPPASLDVARNAALIVQPVPPYFEAPWAAAYASHPDYPSADFWPPLRAAAAAARMAAAHFAGRLEPELLTRAWAIAEAQERRQQAILLRRFLDYPPNLQRGPQDWPASVVELAHALRDGTPCHFALSDALLEIGRPELAQHFRLPVHPQNCWGFERILGE